MGKSNHGPLKSRAGPQVVIEEEVRDSDLSLRWRGARGEDLRWRPGAEGGVQRTARRKMGPQASMLLPVPKGAGSGVAVL